jgi:hypothetical protein
MAFKINQRVWFVLVEHDGNRLCLGNVKRATDNDVKRTLIRSDDGMYSILNENIADHSHPPAKEWVASRKITGSATETTSC